MKKTFLLAIAIAFLGSATGLLAISVGPWVLTRHPSSGMTSDQRLKARNDVRTTLIQGIGAAGLVGGLFFTYRTYRLNISQQVTDRYAKAVEQLGNASEDVRTGAIYALERVIKDSQRDRLMILAALASFARRRSAEMTTHEDVATDLQAVLIVITRTRPNDDIKIVLKNASMKNLELVGGSLGDGVLENADLAGSKLHGIDLSRANLDRCQLTRASLKDCRLVGASLRETDLAHADLRGADLTSANLTGANVRGTQFYIGALSDEQVLSVYNRREIVWLTRDPVRDSSV